MSLLAAWVLFPAIAAIVIAGLGFLVRRIAGDAVPGVLVLPVGLAALVVVAQLTTYRGATAPATVPLVAVLAVVGWGLALRARVPPRRASWAPAAVALATVLAFGAPTILSGQATLTGYVVLGDTAIHLIGADALLEHGRDYASLPPSSYQGALEAYYGASYPSGAPAALGTLTRLSGIEPMWAFVPFLALIGACIALTAIYLLRRFGAGELVAAVGGLLVAQPALLYAYAQMGAVKEVSAALCVLLALALALVWFDARGRGARATVPLAVAVAAGAAVIGAVIAAWVVPILLGALGAAALADGRSLRRLAFVAGAFAVLAAVLMAPTLLLLDRYVEVSSGVLTAQEESGNLVRPLSVRQALGVWIVGDFRFDPRGALATLTTVLGVVVAVAAALALVDGLWRRRSVPALFGAMSVVVMVILLSRGSPWADGKALAITSPLILLVAIVGVTALLRMRQRLVGAFVLAAVACGVVMSNGIAYHDASLAPRDRFSELQTIADRLDDGGSTLLPDWDENAKHFLRDAAPENPNEAHAPRRPLIEPTLPGSDRPGEAGTYRLQPSLSPDLDLYGLRYVASFDAIVMRTRPTTSRPPSIFHRTYRGRYYELWQRDDAAAKRLVAHLAGGSVNDPASEISCRRIRDLARLAGAQATLLYVERDRLVALPVATARRSFSWGPAPEDPNVLRLAHPGWVRGTVSVPRGGRYELWATGSFARRISFAVDRRRVGSVSYQLSFPNQQYPIAALTLAAGRHELAAEGGGGDLRPGNGNGSPNRRLGPLFLAASDPLGGAVKRLAPSRWRELCGRSLDWIDVLRAPS